MRKEEYPVSRSYRNRMPKGLFRRARLRPMVCLACARQGRPQQTMALRAGGPFCGSTVDQHKPDRDLALKDCAPGILAGRGVQVMAVARA